jgi:hypothetical protein
VGAGAKAVPTAAAGSPQQEQEQELELELAVLELKLAAPEIAALAGRRLAAPADSVVQAAVAIWGLVWLV